MSYLINSILDQRNKAIATLLANRDKEGRAFKA